MNTVADIKGNDPRYPLWKFFNDEHGLVLLDGEMDDIIHAVESLSHLTETTMNQSEIEREAERRGGSNYTKNHQPDKFYERKAAFIEGAKFVQQQKEGEAIAFAQWIEDNNYVVRHKEGEEWQMLNPEPPIGKQNDDDDHSWEPLIGEIFILPQLFQLFKSTRSNKKEL